MANLKSFNSNPVDSGSTRRARIIGGAATAAVTAVIALMFVLDFNGCSKETKNANASSSSQGSLSAANPAPSPAVQPATSLEKKNDAVIEKKKPVKRVSTATYANATYGISLRYPKTYTMLVPEKDQKELAWPDPVAMNFADGNGETLTTLVLPGSRASSYFKVSVNKTLNAEQCSKFSTTPEQVDGATNPAETSINPPVDTTDDSIQPSKTNVLGVEFAKAENVTDQSDARYYHHFENGACYEFALGVADAPNTVRPIDHLQVFDKLERIMTTVKIKSTAPETAATPTETSAQAKPVAQPTPATNPQQ
ncbi:MAG TPA: hypothetical protein VFR84_03345 [Candidatus Angelobacter sp.]|nr:hypothetical protein [Candidatus Angelobacter sp.]